MVGHSTVGVVVWSLFVSNKVLINTCNDLVSKLTKVHVSEQLGQRQRLGVRLKSKLPQTCLL